MIFKFPVSYSVCKHSFIGYHIVSNMDTSFISRVYITERVSPYRFHSLLTRRNWLKIWTTWKNGWIFYNKNRILRISGIPKCSADLLPRIFKKVVKSVLDPTEIVLVEFVTVLKDFMKQAIYSWNNSDLIYQRKILLHSPVYGMLREAIKLKKKAYTFFL